MNGFPAFGFIGAQRCALHAATSGQIGTPSGWRIPGHTTLGGQLVRDSIAAAGQPVHSLPPRLDACAATRA